MKPKSLSKSFKGTVLEMLGTAQSTGCRVEGEDPHDIIDQIKEGTLAIPDA
jgi:large subunit ribosomal protein L12e